jgi:tetratricopeptide (TPR) repeat protein
MIFSNKNSINIKILVLVLFLLIISCKVCAKESILTKNQNNQKFYNQFTNKLNNSNIYTKLGISVALEGKLEKAIECFNKAIILDSKNDTAHYNLAICYMKMGKIDLAIDNFIKCNNIYPNYKALINLGALYADKSLYEKSIKYLEQAKAFNEKDVALFYNLGLIYGVKGDYKKAIENFKTVTGIDPDNKNAYYNLGMTYQLIGNNELAIENFNKALQGN